MTKREAEVIVSLAETNLNISKAAEKMLSHRNSLQLTVCRIKSETGADPRNFFDLCRLLPAAEMVLFGTVRTVLGDEKRCATMCCECEYWLPDFGEVCSREDEWFYSAPYDFCSRGKRKTGGGICNEKNH